MFLPDLTLIGSFFLQLLNLLFERMYQISTTLFCFQEKRKTPIWLARHKCIEIIRNFRTNKHEVSLANYKSIRSRFKKPLNNSEVLFEPMDRGKVQTYLPAVYIPHFLYRFLDGKKTSRSQFSILGLREIHKKLNQEINYNSRVSFFRKSPFCTFSCINSGFAGPWDML